MSAAPALPVTPLPLTENRQAQLLCLTEGLDAAALWWLSGYTAGLARSVAASSPAPAAQEAAPAAAAQAATPLSIVFGSQTGNAQRLAEGLAARMREAGLPVRVLRADAYPLRELADERHLIVVISTQGDGEPPDDARGFVEFLQGRRAPRLPQLRYAVLGLGDSSYPQFCAIGRLLDARLEALGASRWLPRGDADLDIASVATPWLERALAEAREALRPQPALATVTPLRPPAPAVQAPVCSRERPFAAELLVNQRITGRGSDRDVRHLELSLAGSGLRYEPGDALGVWPRNDPALVAAVLQALALDGDAPVRHDGETLPLREWLGQRRELTRLARPFVAAVAERSGEAALAALLAPERAQAFAHWLEGRQVLDLVRGRPGLFDAAALVAALRPLTPRLYSIASSMRAVGEEAHLTVAHAAWERAGEARFGVASHFLAVQEEGATLPVFVERNERFRLPRDPDRAIVMIGAGTGVAPFRGFVQERAVAGARGRHWLLFGNPRFRTDFLYQLEWQQALREGRLHRLDLAFSRDQAEKHYVQHRLREHGRTLYAWLENGAHLYVCGATRMGRDVHAALLALVAEHGGRSAEDAADYLDALQRQGRYARDVY
ncbi:assimilatory sulfite reductase (NADPH) flavoprotein subunit [Vulcaniibacterium gelatinicum]|uniref:assimilatory sulfite reductase (NADPH) flavoprotein subunit n=1 Tax=Vulcaniibacterium gelatinicum TaxID=2598725 RepID=UPI0011CAE1ED|nr:assimilatory sulfite reductase (NADPH) flavoprotein subunit [Vulcaniibacterium gelatinicum]